MRGRLYVVLGNPKVNDLKICFHLFSSGFEQQAKNTKALPRWERSETQNFLQYSLEPLFDKRLHQILILFYSTLLFWISLFIFNVVIFSGVRAGDQLGMMENLGAVFGGKV